MIAVDMLPDRLKVAERCIFLGPFSCCHKLLGGIGVEMRIDLMPTCGPYPSRAAICKPSELRPHEIGFRVETSAGRGFRWTYDVRPATRPPMERRKYR